VPPLTEEDQLQRDIEALFWKATNWGGAPHAWIAGKDLINTTVIQQILNRLASEGKDEFWYKAKVRYWYFRGFRYWGDKTLINRVPVDSLAVLKEQQIGPSLRAREKAQQRLS
jgi:hypothetical protein